MTVHRPGDTGLQVAVQALNVASTCAWHASRASDSEETSLAQKGVAGPSKQQ